MPSIIPGYEYDIFISYRQNDNQDGWVTEFVDSLKREITATFKEEISVYFDENPNDGLHEHHDVDESLKEKLKCVILIPIVSQTYCDTNSFAWRNEFKVFIDQASNDPVGLKTKLAGGNVASRVLPVKIHELDSEDQQLFEAEVGGVMRSIDFIYMDTGVNRPMKPDDAKDENLNKTRYRDQINKVANAIKEIINGIKGGELAQEISVESSSSSIQSTTSKPQNKSKVLMATFGSILILALAYFFYSQNNENVVEEEVEKSIAVLLFENMTGDENNQHLVDGLTEEIIYRLSQIKDFDKVISRTSVMGYRDTDKKIPVIAAELNVANVLEGSFRKSGDEVRITVQLINGKTDGHIWSDTYTFSFEEIFEIQSKVAQEIASQLLAEITSEEESNIESIPTSNMDAYEYYLRGNEYFSQASLLGYNETQLEKYNLALQMMEKATNLDPTFALAFVKQAALHRVIFWFYADRTEERVRAMRASISKAEAIDPDLPYVLREAGMIKYQVDNNNDEALKLFEAAKKNAPNLPPVYTGLASVHRRQGKWDLALSEVERAYELDPNNLVVLRLYSTTLGNMKRFAETDKVISKALDLAPDSQQFLAAKVENDERWKGIVSDLYLTESDRDWEARLEYLINNPAFKFESDNTFWPHSFYLARAHYNLGNTTLASQYADSALAEGRSRLLISPNDHRVYAMMGEVNIFRNNPDSAIYYAEKAVSVMPYEKDALYGYMRERDLGIVYAHTGKIDLAINKLEWLLSNNGAFPITVETLKIHPAWDPIRNDHRFQELLHRLEFQVKPEELGPKL